MSSNQSSEHTDTISSHQSHAATFMQQEDARMIRDIFAGYESSELNAVMEAERGLLGLPTEKEQESTTLINTGEASTSDRVEFSSLHWGDIDGATMERAVLSMEEAIQNLPHHKKEAYLLAMKENPRVVAIECPFERFLRANQLDHWAAANQLVEYYAKRLSVYGRERFSRPLRLNGGQDYANSALSPAVQKASQAACFVFPPPDDHGRGVILFERENLQDIHGNNEYRNQSTFYNLHVVSEQTTTQINGYVAMVAFESQQKKCSDDMIEQPPWQAMRLIIPGVTPSTLKGFHMIVHKQATFLNTFIAFWMSFLQKFTCLHLRARVHYVLARPPVELETTLTHLKQYGIHKYHLPSRLGGTVDTYALYKERLEHEEELYAALDHQGKGEVDCQEPTSSEHAVTLNDDDRKTSLSDVRFKQLKRKISRLYDDHQLQVCRRKIAKLQKDKDTLQSRHELLQSYHDCALYVERQYVQDDCTIRRRLADLITPSPIELDESRLDALVDEIMTKALIFHGRNSLSGRWDISIQNLEEWPIQLQPFLVQLKDLLIQTNPLPSNASSSEKSDDVQNEADHGHEDDDDDDFKIASLVRYIQELKHSKETMKAKNTFLRSALLISVNHAKEFVDFKERNTATIVRCIQSLLLVNDHQNPASPQRGAPSSQDSILEGIAHQIMDSVYFVGQSRVFFTNEELIASLRNSSNSRRIEHTIVDLKKKPPPDSTTRVYPASNDTASAASSLQVGAATGTHGGTTVEDRKRRVRQRRKKSLRRL